MTMPPLPRPDRRTGIYRDRWWHEHPLYTADQMRAYGEACAVAERERCAKLCEAQRDTWVGGSDQWGNPCPARVRVTPAMCAAAIRAQGETP